MRRSAAAIAGAVTAVAARQSLHAVRPSRIALGRSSAQAAVPPERASSPAAARLLARLEEQPDLLRIGADIWGTVLIVAILAAMVIFRYL